MKVLFIVQGEGRGHMTQALSLEQILHSHSHSVCGTILGTSKRRSVPQFFTDRTASQVHLVKSPNFYFDNQNKSINPWKTLLRNLFLIPLFIKELTTINQVVKESQPDVIINFYDILGGFYFLLANPDSKRICIAHQYLAGHSKFPVSDGSSLQKRAFRLANYLTSMNSHKKLALSFDELSKENSTVSIVPPLIRSEVLDLEESNDGFILAYVVNSGYGHEILEWHEKNTKVKIQCFWDNYEYPDGWSPRKNITFYHLDDKAFLEAMASCSGYVSTAGFESICEAMYLNKPLMMVPVSGQYEQSCNALDAERVGAGIKSNSFDLSRLLYFITTSNLNSKDFKMWVNRSEQLINKEIEEHIAQQEKRRFMKIKNKSNLPQGYQHMRLDHF